MALLDCAVKCAHTAAHTSRNADSTELRLVEVGMTFAVGRAVNTETRPSDRLAASFALVSRRPVSGWQAFESRLYAAGITRQALQFAREHAEKHQVGIAESLIKLGHIDETACFDLLAQASGFPLVDVARVSPSSLALRLVPERLARRHEILPISEDNRTIVYATARPFDAEAERDINFAAGRTAQARIAPISQLRKALDRIYPKAARLDEICARLRQDAAPVERVDADEASASAIVDIVRQIVARAVVSRASDIHIEPSRDGGHVRFRVGGILEAVTVLPVSAMPLVTNRFKVLAKLDITVRFRPQDGAFRMRVDERMVDCRLSTLPTVHGEKLVLRVIDSATELHTLDTLGYSAESVARIRLALNRPDGLMLVTGPTGSGKTTVLYAGLNHLRTGRTNIVTVEDPVERFVEGVSQIPVNQKGGAGYADVLRSVLRQDPNVIMVGEIRDAEVAGIVAQAAYTGHMVMSSLHTSDAALAITRLVNLGIEPYKVAECLALIVSQRLVRRVCPACSTKDGVTPNSRVPGPGCDECNSTGYAGRTPIIETLVPNEAIRAAITAGVPAAELRKAMRASGCHTLREAGLAAVAEGLTTLEEINRVVSADDQVQADSRRTVLVADDEPVQRRIVRAVLEREGLRVIEAQNGREAIELARREQPDLMLIDLHMPEMDGFDAIRLMRGEAALAQLPIVVVTGDTGPGVERQVFSLGADDYLAKPIEPAILASRVRAVFRRSDRLAA